MTAMYKTDTIVGIRALPARRASRTESLDFEANADYWGEAQDQADPVRLFDKSSALKLALENEDVDIAFRSLQPDENNSFENKAGFKLIEGEGPGIRYVVFNTTAKPWDDPNMRRALAAAVDRKPIVDEVFKGSAKPLPSMMPGHVRPVASRWDGALRRQRPGADARDKGGAAPSGKTLVDKYLSGPGSRRARSRSTSGTARPTTATPRRRWPRSSPRSLEATGRFTVKVSNVEWAEYGQKRRAGEMPVFLMGWYPDYLDPDDYLEPFSDPDIFDPAKWEDQKMLELIRPSSRSIDPAPGPGS